MEVKKRHVMGRLAYLCRRGLDLLARTSLLPKYYITHLFWWAADYYKYGAVWVKTMLVAVMATCIIGWTFLWAEAMYKPFPICGLFYVLFITFFAAVVVYSAYQRYNPETMG